MEELFSFSKSFEFTLGSVDEARKEYCTHHISKLIFMGDKYTSHTINQSIN